MLDRSGKAGAFTMVLGPHLAISCTCGLSFCGIVGSRAHLMKVIWSNLFDFGYDDQIRNVNQVLSMKAYTSECVHGVDRYGI